MNVAIVGATGAVGLEALRILEQRAFPIDELRLFASPRSTGAMMNFRGGSLRIAPLSPGCFDGVNVAFFSAGAAISRDYGPLAVRAGAVVIDNSSAFRLAADVPLIVPEINPDALRRDSRLIANPNCSTIILLMAVAPLHRVARVRRIVVSTYQAVSGAGRRAMEELEEQTRAVLDGRPVAPRVLPHRCAFNVFSHNSDIGADGANVEERKMAEETRKILGDDGIGVAATCVRVPVMRAHSESILLEFERPMPPPQAREILVSAPGVRVVDDCAGNHFPMPIEAAGGDDVLVGRLRSDPSRSDGRGLLLFASGDQLRKGAALNAVQIAETVCLQRV